ncbi:MAG: hypothetical protein JSR45_07420 [Proteobacteria bacterium]|nr:hypothetical protein [Pseudomonadota bacterium]
MSIARATAACAALLLLSASPAPRSEAVNLAALRAAGGSEVRLKSTDFRGVKALEASVPAGHDGLVAIPGRAFHDGTITLRVAGSPGPGANPTARGFVGVAFRVEEGKGRYELFYLRPTNGRADDQLRRNHSLQYVSAPDWPWERLRKETPGQYESYADLQPDVWTTMRIEVKGTKAQLYVNGAAQPALIVNDLKAGDSSGGVALWIGPGTVAHFADMKVVRR